MRGATKPVSAPPAPPVVSIHAPHAGRDCGDHQGLQKQAGFNPRAPCGARRFNSAPVISPTLFQSTRPMRGATYTSYGADVAAGVSIHAPHAGRDGFWQSVATRRRRFNPRAPCGARREGVVYLHVDVEFQSTRPMRGATHSTAKSPMGCFVSIPAPHAGRDVLA